MAFLYRSTTQGATGKDGSVEVVDIPAMTVVSFGMRGDATEARVAEAKVQLEEWLKRNSSDYQAAGPLRVMGYNSPFVPVERRFSEIEIPIRSVQ